MAAPTGPAGFSSGVPAAPLVQIGGPPGRRRERLARRLPGLATGLRREQRQAAATSYEPPAPGLLSVEWFDGRRWLDETTRLRRAVVSAACIDAPPAQVAADGSAYLPPSQPLPLVTELSVRFVENAHLWIGVQLGTALVLDDAEDDLLTRLAAGATPAAVVAERMRERGELRVDAWRAVARLVARLVDVGFLRGIQDHLEERHVDPQRFLRIHLTQRCNLACSHCYADSSPVADTGGQLTPQRWKELITEFARHGGERVLFTGGEALLYKGCDELLLHSKAEGLHVTLFSNGFLVERHLEAIRRACDVVQISVDGADAEANDPIRGEGSFEQAVHAIDVLAEAGVPVRVSTVLMEQNLASIRDRFDDFAGRWDGRKVDFRLGNGLITHGRGENVEDALTHDQAREVIDRLERRWAEFGRAETFRRTTGCGYCEQVVVGQDGKVHPCHLLDGAIAHVDELPFGELLDRLRSTKAEYDVDHTLGCNLCDIRYLCGGECRVDNGKHSGNRRVTSCQASDKLRRLRNLVRTYDPHPNAQTQGGA